MTSNGEPGGGGRPSFTGVKVFSATKAKDREEMGEVITRWLKDHPRVRPVDREVVQSSDREFHCLTIALFYREDGEPDPADPPVRPRRQG